MLGKIKRYHRLVLRLVLGGVFMLAAMDKVLHPDLLQTVIGNYQLLPAAASHYLAMVLPWTELVCGFLLLAGFYEQGATFLISTMLTGFMIAMLSALWRGLDIACGCFTLTGTAEMVSILRIIEDAVLLLIALYLLLKPNPGTAVKV